MLETGVHYPTDANLLWDAARKCIQISTVLSDRFSLEGWRKHLDWESRLKTACRKFEKTAALGGPQKDQRVPATASEYLRQAAGLETKVHATLGLLAKQELQFIDYHKVEGVLICGGWAAPSPAAAISRKIRSAGELDWFAVSAPQWPWGTAAAVLTLDMGRAMLKSGYCGIQRKFARNFDKFPLGKAVARERKHCRRDITTFAGRKLAAVVREAAKRPEMLLIAFPGKVSPEGTPLEEAWPGLSDWQEAAVTIRFAAGLGRSHLLSCSDTELAAWSALMAPVAADWDRFAVITTGAGLGLALVDRSKAT